MRIDTRICVVLQARQGRVATATATTIIERGTGCGAVDGRDSGSGRGIRSSFYRRQRLIP